MNVNIRNKFVNELTILFTGERTCNNFRVNNVRVVNSSEVKDELGDLIKCMEDSDKPSDYAEVIFVAKNGSLFYLYTNHIDDNTNKMTLSGDRMYVNGYIITPFGSTQELSSNPYIDLTSIDGLIVCEIDIKDDEFSLSSTFEENLLFDDDSPKLIPLVYDLLNNDKSATNEAKELLDRFIDSYDTKKEQYHMEKGNLDGYYETSSEKFVIDIETGGFTETGQIHIFKDVPKPKLPNSEGKLFSV